jgi:UDP-2,4-diacetamido-2,4,6-trideoxy-beta-L-altropyranose hydrolase
MLDYRIEILNFRSYNLFEKLKALSEKNFNMLIRADALPEIGIGHVMRCLSLAQAINNNKNKTVFVTNISSSFLEDRLISEGIEVHYLPENLDQLTDIQETIKIVQKLQKEWVIVDGYHFNGEYQKQLKKAGLKVLFFDDYGHCDYYYADIILNQNLGANKNLYLNRKNYTQLLLGTNYTLLRKEFWQWREWQRGINPVAKKILVTLGGSDPDNFTLKVIKALYSLSILPNLEIDDIPLIREELEVIVIVGGSNPHFQELSSFCQSLDFNITLKRNVTNISELMAWADLAIAAGGSTNWELAFMGLPSIIITIADNQKEIAEKLGQMGLTISLGWHEEVTVEMIAEAIAKLKESPEQRYQMSKQGRKLIDGYGSSRVLEKMGLINH